MILLLLRNLFGQLGMETDVLQPWPDRVDTLINADATILDIKLGGFHTLFLVGYDGSSFLYTTGSNHQGQLGFPRQYVESRTVAKLLPTAETPVEIAAGFFASAYRSATNRVYIWGLSTYDTPRLLPLNNVTHVAAGIQHWVVASDARNVSVIFKARDKHLFDNSTVLLNKLLAIRVVIVFESDITLLEMSELTCYIMLNNGKAFSFGDSLFGERCVVDEYGNAPSKYDVTLVHFPISCQLKSIDAGAYHAVFFCENGKIFGCGSSFLGQLGTTNQSLPIPSAIFEDLPRNYRITNVIAGGYVTFVSVTISTFIVSNVIYVFLGTAILILAFCVIVLFFAIWCRRQPRVQKLDDRSKKLMLEAFKSPNIAAELGMAQIQFSSLKNLREIGCGTSSVVFKAQYESKTVAVKLFRVANVHVTDSSIFDNELSILKKLQHENIIEFYGACSRVRMLYSFYI